MEISKSKNGDVDILRFDGMMDSNTSQDAEIKFDELIDEGAKKILISFSDLAYISSAGLRVLLGLAKELMGSGGELRLSNMNETVKEVFDISGFSTIFKIFSTEEEALLGF